MVGYWGNWNYGNTAVKGTLMKKIVLLLLLLLLFLLLSSVVAFAWNPMVVTSGSTEEAVDCPSYYASAVISMDFENGLNACDSSGSEVELAGGSSDIGAYGDGGGQAMKCDASGEQISVSGLSGNAYLDPTTDQTICIKIYKTGNPSAHTQLIRFEDTENTDFVYIDCRTDGSISGQWVTESQADDSVGGWSPGSDTWAIIAYSFEGAEIGSNAMNQANPGDTGTWLDGWNEAEDDLQDMDDPITKITIGASGSPSVTFYIDEWAVFDGYGVDCSTYMD